ncbi:ribosomal protein S5 domain 2-type protein [Radiomyces spectabilis]|uniref:ribosomal protein S5 domain 2-type protein n=1 Tax=Radiomyces spectabilis TaxID=64574 RepID=UPI00221F383B|nr:ribosomal protein S5 domain 2-type protein [Radiomyces spectabilis]KAI8384245.1 ribosomal protein S5 domain 2-type protein [Radiomyces spectabilis]
MSRLELLTPEGLRIDGRRANELRKITAKTSVFSQADGSAYIEQGNTKCLAAVYGPREARHRMQMLADRALINVEFNVAPFSTSERKKRTKNDKRSLEVATFIRQTFEPVIQTSQFPRSQIDIYLQIFQHDGGILQACINAATMALVDAGIPMIDYVCACSAGCIDKIPVLDLNNLEESSDTPEMTVAILPRTGKVNLVEMESRLHIDKLASVTELATQGCMQIHEILDSVIRDNTQHLMNRLTA